VFVKRVAPPNTPRTPQQGDITLNFENTDVREVVKVILGDLLGVNYILDPAVQGSVTMETGRPLNHELLLPTLETLLRMNKAALVNKGGTYNVMPITTAMQGTVTPQLGESSRPLPKGYSVRIVPLNYIGATEMSKILKPLASEGSIIRVDPVRNLLVLAGSGPELGSLLETIDMFDVNWIKGLSVGLFRIQHGNLQEIVKQIDNLTSGQEDNPLAGMFRVVPMESANSLLVVTHQQEYLDQIATWIDRLDQAGADSGSEPTLYVYRVKHGDADNLAQILSQLFSEGQAQGSSAARVAPGLRASAIRSRGTSSPFSNSNAQGATSGASSKSSLGSPSLGFAVLGGNTMRSSSMRNSSMGSSSMGSAGMGSAATGSLTLGSGTTGTSGTSGQATGYHLESGVSIVADSVNNSLLIRATPAQYRQIANALDKLDIQPLQVLVEATIVEVSLSGDLKYGLEWFFQARNTSHITWDGNQDSTTSGLGGLFPGFNWSLAKAGGEIRAVLSAFAGDGLVKVLSSPSVMVLDNHTARIQVGDEVPILTGQQQSSVTGDRFNSVDYRDTGVLLAVTPRVTPGGLVIMEVQQEVSDVATTSQSAVGSPTISTRNIASTVAVKDGQVVVLGGLIRDKKEGSQSGVPGLYKVPLLGWAFGQTSKSASRTELVVILTPKVLRDDQDLSRVTDEFRTKLQGLKERF